MLAPTSWFSILFPSLMFIKSCGRALTPGGAENRGSGDAAGPHGGRCFGMRELARRGWAQVRYIISEASPTARERGPGCDGLAPWASTASQYTAPNSLNKHCSLSVSATGKPGSDQLPQFFWCFICIYIYMNMNILCECVWKLLFF